MNYSENGRPVGQYRPSLIRDKQTRLADDLSRRISSRPLAISLRLEEVEQLIEALVTGEPK